MKPHPLGLAYLSTVYLFLYLPIIVLVVFSFNHSQYSGLWHGFTGEWYRSLWEDSDLQIIAEHSLLLGITAATGATALAAIAANALFQYRFYGKHLWQLILFMLITLPDLVLGIALLLLFSLTHVSLGFWTLFLAHITFCLPFAFAIIYARLCDTDRRIFEAAKDLGASDFVVFSKITLPLMRPALIAAWLLSFTLSLDDVVVSFFVTGPDYQILPLYIFSEVRIGVTPELNALCSVILGLTIILAVISQWVLRKR